jgi:SAM-dependent methyltransferase
MPADSSNSTHRFTDRVADYVRYRPSYPAELIEILEDVSGLSSDWVVADVGSGTGISARPFLEYGCTVYGVEPNDAMRVAAEAEYAGEPRFRSVKGTAEATTLGTASVDLIIAAQAFHWFDPMAARREFARILRPPGWVAVFFNERLTDTPFLREYEEMLHTYATDYAQVDHRNVSEERLRAFFGGPFDSRSMPNHQDFDFEGLKGRLLSSSYAPAEGHPRHEPMLAALRDLYRVHQKEGRVRFLYETQVHVGRLAAA